IVLNLINNIFGCGSMILAGAQLVTGITGMHIVAACILIPAGVVIYTAVGGLKATFITDYLHTAIALILLIYFSLSVLTNEHIGGISGLYHKVKATDDYIKGNYMGSLLTMKSKPAVLFGLVLKLGNLALVLMDTAFWQKSFASEVESVVPAYDLVSVVILAVPWCTGTIIGLSARAIEKTPVWFDYPNLLTEKQVNSGLVMPYVLRSLLGKGATSGLLVLIFMAITSTVSSSVIAVSSIISQDFYRSYINPKASDRKILKVSHFGVVGHGCFMAGFAIMLQYAGATNNWSTYFRPIVACPGIFPLILTLLWSRQTKAAAILSPVLGLAAGVATWLSLSYVWGGKINIQTTQEQLPGLYGALVSFFSPALFSVIISLARPSKFDWRVFLKIDLIEDSSQPSTSLPSPQDSKEDINRISQISRPAQQPLSEKDQIAIDAESKAGLVSPASSFSARTGSLDDISHPFSEQTIRHIKKWRTYAAGYFVVNLLVTVVLWPVPMYRDYIFTVPFFTGWIIVAIIWHFAAMMAVIVYPIWDGRHVIDTVLQGKHGYGRKVQMSPRLSSFSQGSAALRRYTTFVITFANKDCTWAPEWTKDRRDGGIPAKSASNTTILNKEPSSIPSHEAPTNTTNKLTIAPEVNMALDVAKNNRIWNVKHVKEQDPTKVSFLNTEFARQAVHSIKLLHEKEGENGYGWDNPASAMILRAVVKNDDDWLFQ
ncbi:SSS family solute:Na+ symporter, partial [Aureobasidium melanogenum]